MLVNHKQRSHVFMLAAIFGLMAITLYMAFASPFSGFFTLKQFDTTQVRAVILVGRHGEVTPSRDAYFEPFGEEPPENWYKLGGADQLTRMGAQRMYLLGKFLRLRYYDKLLQGNPRRLFVRSDQSDKCLESAQALAAGLNPPVASSSSSWLAAGEDFLANLASKRQDQQAQQQTPPPPLSSQPDELLERLWQPKAIHTTSEQLDDLLSSKTRCLVLDSLLARWKNSSQYAELLNEFRHDLETLRQNTGLEFEDDLEMVQHIEQQLRARASLAREAPDGGAPPTWYTETFASRLAHVADATGGCRFAHSSSQRLFVGRLLDTITRNIFSKIRSDLTGGVSLLEPDGQVVSPDEDEDGPELAPSQREAESRNQTPDGATGQMLDTIRRSLQLPAEERNKLKLAQMVEPNVYVYLTDQQHLSALLQALKIYSSAPLFGSTLLIELHHDPVNQVHFLRLFTVNSQSHNLLPEPVRVNPIACLGSSVECSPQQFERNIRPLRVDKPSWLRMCQATPEFGSGPDEGATPIPAAQTEASSSRPTSARPGQPEETASTAATTTTTSTTTTASTTTITASTPGGPTERSEPARQSSETPPAGEQRPTEASGVVGPISKPISGATEGGDNNEQVAPATNAPTLIEVDQKAVSEPPTTTSTLAPDEASTSSGELSEAAEDKASSDEISNELPTPSEAIQSEDKPDESAIEPPADAQ